MKVKKKREAEPSVPGLKLRGRCGSGQTSEVWLGVDRHRKLCAVRLVSKKRNPDLLAAERCGVGLYSRLSGGHANLLKILETGETADYLYSITEAADNAGSGYGIYEPDTLAGRLCRRGLTAMHIFNYLEVILDGIKYLHERNTAHCDLKPENILFVNRELKIGDPGLVSPLDKDCSGGTAGFRPPWNAKGKECDIYAFGKMIYMLCTRENPLRFPEIPEQCNLAAFMPLNEIALGCCESDPRQRFGDIDEIRQELSRVRLGVPPFQDLGCRME